MARPLGNFLRRGGVKMKPLLYPTPLGRDQRYNPVTIPEFKMVENPIVPAISTTTQSKVLRGRGRGRGVNTFTPTCPERIDF